MIMQQQQQYKTAAQTSSSLWILEVLLVCLWCDFCTCAHLNTWTLTGCSSDEFNLFSRVQNPSSLDVAKNAAMDELLQKQQLYNLGPPRSFVQPINTKMDVWA